MRISGMSLIGTVVVALLLNTLATAVTAQDDQMFSAPGDFVFVEGRETNQQCDEFECTAEHVMSDPRVSGELAVQLDLGCSTEMICWMGGGITITNDDGAWDGRWVGFINDDAPGGRSHDQMMWLEGGRAYEGWSYVAVLSDLDKTAALEDGDGLHPGTFVRGVFYRGDLPPSVAPSLVAAAR